MASVTIEKRSAWAQHITHNMSDPNRPANTFIARYSMPPMESSREWTPWKGGFFIHYMGSRGSFSPSSEIDCRKRIAEKIFPNHWRDSGDIYYNFLVCPHGTVYEGRGYERGEANGGARITVGGTSLGRNTSFYSIQGMLAVEDQPNNAMLDSMRNLMFHLRYEASDTKKAGHLILPHSAGWNTKCPGEHLTQHAKRGSRIDPTEWAGGSRPVPEPVDRTPQLRIISRSSWGARPPRSVAKVSNAERTGFVVHYSAAGPDQTVRTNGCW
ncbi:hypothetical protein AB0903_31840 [Streptomyces sp. NPDC048389]|uniref:hypothetical protein n=1 Tax=Streptomyces sp. NPDC048389 TaxID=3154622 RepID=UPI003454DEEF